MLEIYRSPPFDLDGYRAFTVRYEDGSKRTALEHREVMSAHIGRSLGSDEIVHHKDKNKLNNDINNLELMSPSEHGLHHAPTPNLVTLSCKECGCEFQRKARWEKHNRNQGKTGPFCGRSCAARWSRNPCRRSPTAEAPILGIGK